MAEDTSRNSPNSTRDLIKSIPLEFKTAVSTLWDQNIRADLIFVRGLMCCKSCLGFFYKSDMVSNHPTNQSFLVSKLCMEQRLNNEQLLCIALWVEAQKLFSDHGTLLIPRMSSKHLEPPKEKITFASDSELTFKDAKINLLEQELLSIQNERVQLHSEIRTLTDQVNRVVKRLVLDAAAMQRLKLSAEQHLNSLMGLLHPEVVEDEEIAEGTP